MTRWAYATVLTLCYLIGITHAEEEDKVQEKLDQAISRFESQSEKYHYAVLAHLEARKMQARKKGDKTAIEEIDNELREFEKSGKQPTKLPRSIAMQLTSARSNMEASYKVAIREYTKSGQDELAVAVEEQYSAFREGLAINLLQGDRLDHFIAEGAIESHWQLKDGVLRFDGRGKEVYNLATKRNFKNFILSLEWRISPGGDSGVLLRGVPQVQIWDHTNGKGRQVGSGGLYNNVTQPRNPSSVEDRPIGQWNKMIIAMADDRVTVTLNGKIVTYDVRMENYPEIRKPLPAEGPIVLQAFDSIVEFQNVYVQETP